MKQRIEINQLKELTETGCDNLLFWLLNKGYERQLTIGHMIEFISDHKGTLDLWTISNDVGSSVYIGLHGDPHPSKDFEKYHGEINSELCDALWEAVKEILEKGSL